MYNGFPATYNPYYIQNQAAMQNNPPAQSQMQAGGFIRVQSENQARMYPVQPGTSATFINENAPYCYTKTLDFSQLDRPIFKKFRLVEETEDLQNVENAPQEAAEKPSIDLTGYALKADMDALNARIDGLQKILDSMMKEAQEHE